MMGGTMRSPLTAIMFAFELTHEVNVLPALLVSCIAAHAFTVLALRRSILTEKVARRGFHISREYAVDPLEVLRVEDVMDTEVQSVPPLMKVSQLSDRIAVGDTEVTRHNALPIVEGDGRLLGIITRGDVLRSLGREADETVLEAGTRDLIVVYPDELLRDAAQRMLTGDVGRLPVVTRETPRQLVGYIGRPALLSAWRHRMVEEHERESGWRVGTP